MDWDTFLFTFSITVASVIAVAIIGYFGSEKLTKDNRKHLRQMADKEQENHLQMIQKTEEREHQKEQEKQHQLKQQLFEDIVNATWLDILTIYSTPNPHVPGKQRSHAEVQEISNEGIEKRWEIIFEYCQLLPQSAKNAK